MKKLALMVLLVILAIPSFATVTFTLVSNPCDTNKVLVVHYSGGTGPYSVRWTGGTSSGYVYHSGITGLTDTIYNYAGGHIQTSVYGYTGPQQTFLDSGNYYLAPTFSFAFASVAPHCTSSATAAVIITGGTAPYTYSWYSASTNAVLGNTNPTTLPNGYYGINIWDAAGCYTSSVVQNIPMAGGMYYISYLDTIQATPTYSVNATATPANCTNGTAAVTGVNGSGVPPYTYLWSNGATTASISGLVTGVYGVTVTDALGCVGNGGAYVPQAITVTVAITPTPATCLASDGAVIGFGSGGAPPYTYLWNNGATTQSQTGIYAGAVNLTVTDANGCTGHASNNVAASTPITVTYTATPSLCTSPTGTATLTISGGTAPYTTTFYTAPLQTGNNPTNLAPGTYSFHVVDAVGCIRDGAVVVPPIDIINVSFSAVPALCTLANGALNLSLSGGVTPYTYHWSTGATTSSLTGQPSGSYSVVITDNNSCAVTKTGYIPFTSPVTLGLASTPATCKFNHDGIATATGIGGTAPYTYHWSNGGNTASITGLATGGYYVYVTDVNGCAPIGNYSGYNYDYVDYDHADSSCLCVINGVVYHDVNNNCVQDAGEPGINHIQIYCSGIGYTYTDANGAYSFIVPAGSYVITQTIQVFYPLSGCFSNNVPVTTSAGPGCMHTVNFADTVNPIHDIDICTWDFNHPVPGNNYKQVCVVSNNGTLTESNILGGYRTDGQIFSPLYTPSGIFTGGSNWYNTTGGSGLALAPGTSQLFYIDYTVPTFIPVNTSLLFKDSAAYAAPMSNWLADYTPWNNVNYFTSTVLSSYDPNFVEVTPQGTGTNGQITYADSTLQYMVHFQNTGTYQAQNIEVIDTLDANLDWTSLRPVFESAPCKVTMGTNGIVKFTFTDINLPTVTSNAVTSCGMFTYTIKTRPAMPVGTQFKNHASIYFDYNAPVLTNTTVNTLGTIPALSVGNVTPGTLNSFSIYPNPAKQTFNAIINSDLAADATMSVTDVTGKVLMNKTIAMQKGVQTITTDASQLAPGIYFVTFSNHGNLQTQKLVIMK